MALSKEEHAQMLEMRKRGLTMSEIGVALGHSKSAISGYLFRISASKPTAKGPFTPDEDAMITKLRVHERMTLTQIAEKLGRHRRTVSKRAKKLGLPPTLASSPRIPRTLPQKKKNTSDIPSKQALYTMLQQAVLNTGGKLLEEEDA
jgi:DNA-binding CsgD family transcriptional regulator